MEPDIQRTSSGELARQLDALYGEHADGVLRKVLALAADRGNPNPVPAPSEPPWSAMDAWLITYPDQFRRDAEPPLGVLRGFYDTWLRRGFNGVHVLPCYPWTSDDGYAVVDYLEIDPSHGTWSDVEALAAECRLMLDAVVNHMSASSHWFQRFLAGDSEYAGFFRTADPTSDLSATVRPRTSPLLTCFEASDGPIWAWTTFSADQVDLDYRTPEVFVTAVRVLYEYARRGADMIRLDAVQFIGKQEGTSSINLPEAHAVVRALRAALDVVYPNVLLVSESNVPHAENLAYLGQAGEREAQIIYQFPLAPLVLHTMITGDARHLQSWVSSLPSPRPGTTYLNFLASHDGVGVRPVEGILSAAEVGQMLRHTEQAGGKINARTLPDGQTSPYELASTWFDLMASGYSEPEAIQRHLAAHAIMFALQGIPAVYVHSVFGTSNDHDLAARTGMARSLNRHKFDDTLLLADRLADEQSRAGRVMRSMVAMAEARSRTPAFAPEAPQRVLTTAPSVFGVERDGRRRVYVNVGSAPVAINAREWVTSDGDAVHKLEPWQVVWLRPADES